VLAVVAGGAIVYANIDGTKHPAPPASGGPAGDTGRGYLVPAATRVVDVCLDKSGSVDKDGRLAGRATDLLEKRVPTLDPPLVKPYTTRATAPVAGIDLTVRVVRANSYDTTPDTQYIVPVVIPATPGLKQARPEEAQAGLAWDADEATAEAAWTKATAAQKTAAKTLAQLTRLTSNGSDVVGCVAADLGARGVQTPVRLWIVSDLVTIQPRAADGKPLPAYRGAFSKATVVISQACPGGNQAACDNRLATFKDLLAGLGISADRIEVRPSASLEQAYALWIEASA
jgi:hypothetical protein